VLFIKLLPTFHIHLISHKPTILDATSYVEISIDALTGVVWGLIHLLISIVVAAPASLGVWRVPILV
jgi:hypothetical protein